MKDGREHLPAVGGVAGRDVLVEGDVGVVLDRDVVVVVEDDQVAQLLGAGQGAGLGGDTLLEVAVRGDDVDVVVEGGLTLRGLRVEQPALAARGHGHAHGGGQALAQRAGGDLDAVGVAVLGVARGLGAPGAQLLEVLQLEAKATQEELDVLRQRGVAAGEHEPVAAGPVHVSRVVVHDPLVEGVGERSEAHRGAGVARPAVLDGVGRQDAGGVDGTGVGVRPVVRVPTLRQCLQFRRKAHCSIPLGDARCAGAGCRGAATAPAAPRRAAPGSSGFAGNRTRATAPGGVAARAGTIECCLVRDAAPVPYPARTGAAAGRRELPCGRFRPLPRAPAPVCGEPTARTVSWRTSTWTRSRPTSR